MLYLRFMAMCLNIYLLFFQFVGFFISLVAPMKLSPRLNVSSVLKINSPKYQTVPVILNSVPYPPNILNRSTFGEKRLVFGMWKSPLYTCISPLLECKFLNQISTQTIFSPSMFSVFNSMIYSWICQLVHFAVLWLGFKSSTLLPAFTLQFKSVTERIKDFSSVFNVKSLSHSL